MPSKRVAALTHKPYNDNLPSEYEATPSLSSADGDNDGSSDFAPETPTPGDHGDDIKPDLYASDDDLKPDIDASDEDPVHGEEADDEDDSENYGRKKQAAKKRKAGGEARTAPGPAKTKRSSASAANGATPAKLGAAWTGTEDWALFQCVHPKVSKPDWKSVAQAVGRDAKVRPQAAARLLAHSSDNLC